MTVNLSQEGARRRGRALLWALAVTVSLAFFVGPAGVASADCTTGGTGCLPGTGYTFDQRWNCGSIDSDLGTYCYYNETKIREHAALHTWGWGSAAYNGSGSTFVCVIGEGHFEGCGVDLARACYFANCNDQESSSFQMSVGNFGDPHTVWGHGEA